MRDYTITQQAEIRRHELTAEATYHRQTRRRRHPRRPGDAFAKWLAAGQL